MKFKIIGMLVLFSVGAGYNGTVHAEFLTTLTVVETPEAGGLLRYEYSLTNRSDSDLPAVSLAIEVSAQADVQSIAGPPGWDFSYNQGDSPVSWDASAPGFALLPGQHAIFSFLSPAPPTLNRFGVVGLDDATSRIEFNQGWIDAPGVATIPEPTSMIPLGTGLIAVGCYTWHRRRYTSKYLTFT